MVRPLRLAVCVAAVVALAAPAPAILNTFRVCSRDQVDNLNRKLAGRVLDFTSNHGADRRIWSPALGAKRDVYVYLPPGYDGRTTFPVMLWFHGYGQDEKNFLDIAPYFDREITSGRMPPLVIAAPDGSVSGRPSLANTGSFYLNSHAGRFGDYVTEDVWGFVRQTFAVHPDRGAHVLAGGSMGGFAAYNLGIKHRDQFGVLVGVMPPLNLRYVDCHGRYFGPYDPNCVAMRDELRPHQVVGRFYGVILVRERRLTRPLTGARNPDAMGYIARENPIEMLAAYDVRPGELAMFVGYAGRDEFNIDSQCKHFLDVARARGLEVTAVELPEGKHETASGVRMLPAVSAFLARHLAAFAPPGYRPPGCPVVPPLPIPVRPLPGAPEAARK
jgi:S-formylglutathione hydrolase FrmB